METANATHMANYGLSALYALISSDTEDAATLVRGNDAWRQDMREYQADPEAWDRGYYQRMIFEFAKKHGPERARRFGARLVHAGELRSSDVDAALAGDPNPTET